MFAKPVEISAATLRAMQDFMAQSKNDIGNETLIFRDNNRLPQQLNGRVVMHRSLQASGTLSCKCHTCFKLVWIMYCLAACSVRVSAGCAGWYRHPTARTKCSLVQVVARQLAHGQRLFYHLLLDWCFCLALLPRCKDSKQAWEACISGSALASRFLAEQMFVPRPLGTLRIVDNLTATSLYGCLNLPQMAHLQAATTSAFKASILERRHHIVCNVLMSFKSSGFGQPISSYHTTECTDWL